MCRSQASEWLITTQGPLPCSVQFSSMPLLLTFIVFLSSCCRALAPVPVRQKVEILPCKDDPFFRPARPPARRRELFSVCSADRCEQERHHYEQAAENPLQQPD